MHAQLKDVGANGHCAPLQATQLRVACQATSYWTAEGGRGEEEMHKSLIWSGRGLGWMEIVYERSEYRLTLIRYHIFLAWMRVNACAILHVVVKSDASVNIRNLYLPTFCFVHTISTRRRARVGDLTGRSQNTYDAIGAICGEEMM